MGIQSHMRKVYRMVRENSCGCKGDYKIWDEAARQAAEYDQENILLKVKEAMLKLKRGEAVYERDSVLFDEIDNIYFNYKSEGRICIQKVPPHIYEVSYPCWLMNYNKLLATICKKYIIVSERQNESSIYVDGKEIRYRGFLAKKQSKQI